MEIVMVFVVADFDGTREAIPIGVLNFGYWDIGERELSDRYIRIVKEGEEYLRSLGAQVVSFHSTVLELDTSQDELVSKLLTKIKVK